MHASAGLQSLYEQNRDALLRFLTARTGDSAEAEDLLQELWFRVHGSAPTGPIASGPAYLFRMAHNLVIDRVREQERRMRRDFHWAESAAQDSEPPADVAIAERQEQQALAAAIAALPEGARRAFELQKIQGLSQDAVAARLGISKSGVEKHIAVAMKHLRRALRTEAEDRR